MVMGSKSVGVSWPTVVKESESVGDRSSLAKEERALELVHLQLSRVDGHDEEGDTGSEEFLSEGMSLRMFHSGCGAWEARSRGRRSHA